MAGELTVNEALELLREQRDAFGDIKAYARLTDVETAQLILWAQVKVFHQPALRSRFFRPDGRPKLGSIMRQAALDHAAEEQE